MQKTRVKENIRFRWFGMGIRNRLLLMFSALVVFSVGLCATVLSVYWSRERMNSFDAYSDEITKQVSMSVDSSLQNIDRLAISIIYSDVIQQALTTDYGQRYEGYATNEKTVGWYLANFKNAYNGIQSIYVYDRKGNLFATPISFINPFYRLWQEEWLDAFAESEELTCVLGPYVNRQEVYPAEEVISVVRKVKDMETMEDAGYIFINIKMEEILNDNLQKDWESDDGSLLIVTDQNHIVFDSGKVFAGEKAMDEAWFAQLKKSRNHFNYEYNGEKNRVVFSTCENSGWYVVRIAEHDKLYQSVHKMVMFSAVIAGLIILMVFVPMLAFANSFSRPIIKLQKSMLHLTNSDFDPLMELEGGNENEIILAQDGNDEISLLIESFNHMTVKLYSMIQEIRRAEDEKYQLEIAALSAQINPHFTYNTLGTIKQMALLQNAKGIADLTDSIINLLRATAKYGDGISTLRKELDLLRDYISIMQMRYYENFDCHITAEDDVLDTPMLCMLLQPIVENAIFHGIYGIDRMGVIELHACIAQGKLCITIADNGKGIDMEEIQMFLEDSCYTKKKNDNVGVYNVHKRIQLHYGKEYGLKFGQNQPYGTVVTILIPLEEAKIHV